MKNERELLDASLAARGMDEASRVQLWSSVDEILSRGPVSHTDGAGATGLALGYVQSGKTTAITAMIAEAADLGYRVIVCLLGSTNLLLDQNAQRLSEAIGIDTRTDYKWVIIPNPSGKARTKEITDWLTRGRTVVIPILKHSGRIDSLAEVLASAVDGDVPVLIVDDEADQASLNTKASEKQESRTYEAITGLRKAVPRHLYVQFTATPYAALLLEAEDHLRPDFVTLLHPGPGYTGGREFFVDNASRVVRTVPSLDEQKPRNLPTMLPGSLVTAFGSFVAGTALLLGVNQTASPISMLVHSTQRNDVQSRYHFLLERLKRSWADQAATAADVSSLPAEIVTERARIVGAGAPDIPDADFLELVRYTIRETTMWLVNSASDVKKIDWRVAPVHVLVGGNKLDRGFTVEGLTVTYMNRPASDQIDTLEQRARAFGYRQDMLPYCQFFATPRTLKMLREIVDTEYDLRARLRDCLESGGTVTEWARDIGLLLPPGARPSRDSVLGALARFNTGPAWHQLRRPLLDAASRAANDDLVARLGIASGVSVDYGRLWHPTITMPLRDVVSELLAAWTVGPVGSSPGWRHDDLVDLLGRMPNQAVPIPVIYLQHPDGGPRQRAWDSETGFVNLLQGPDRTGPYPGDRMIGGIEANPEQIVIEIHRVTSTEPGQVPELHTIAVHAGRRQLIRKV